MADTRAAVLHVLSELDVASLASRILDPERMRPVVVVTSGSRPPSARIDPARIAASVGPDVEVAAIPPGPLTYSLERALPAETNVFGDAARTYPVGTAWHTRTDLAPLRFCRADSDAHSLEAQIIADARSAARHAGTAVAPQRPTPMAPSPRVMVTPASLAGGSRRPAPSRPDPAGDAMPAPATAGLGPLQPPTVPALRAAPSGPTPASPRGAPPRPIARPASTRTPSTGVPLAHATNAGPRRLPDPQPWHARSYDDGHALATHLQSAARTHPVLVLSTPSEGSTPLINADDLHSRVHEIADVVVLHNGPASWALADALPARTEVYGGAGRVYPVQRGWLTDPYVAPLRFCWPHDNPSRVADTLEDDAYAAANLDGLLTATTPITTIPVVGTVTGLVARHHAALRLDRGGQALLVVDELVTGVDPNRLLQPGQRLTGRVEPGPAIPRFLPDPVTDNPAGRIREAYRPGDVVLARVRMVGAQTATVMLHPAVPIQVHAGAEEPDLRNLLAEGDIVTIELLDADGGAFAAALAHANAPSVASVPVLPGGPAWLNEDDLPHPSPAPEAEPASLPQLGAARLEPAPPLPATGPEPLAVASLTPATVKAHGQVAALQAQIADLAARLDRAERDADTQRDAARTAREEARRLRTQVRSLKDQHEAYRTRVHGTNLFDDPAEQLDYDITQAWLHRYPSGERHARPLRPHILGPGFLNSLGTLEGISRDKVIDVLVEVLTDRAKDLPGRDLHPLRTNDAGGDQRVRHDGARAWRCALQINTASARRLHYWTLPDGSVELEQVGTHDDGL